MKTFENIDQYLSSLPSKSRVLLSDLRACLAQLVPKANETINYGIPTLKLNGNLVHFAAYKTHIGLYPGSKAIENFEDLLTDYKTSKGTIQFPIDKPLPMDLIKTIVAFCVTQNLKKKKKN